MKRKTKKVIKYGLIIIIIVMVLLCAYYFLFVKNKNDEIKILDNIESYGYVLEDRDTSLYQEYFNKLKNELNKDEINDEEYAKDIASLFIIDLYTMNNKSSKQDVGGSEFVLDSYQETYKLKVKDTIYKYLGNEKNKSYPEVASITIDNVEESTYKYNDEKLSSYVINLSWTYVKDLKYDKKGIITIIKDNNKLYIVDYSHGDK